MSRSQGRNAAAHAQPLKVAIATMGDGDPRQTVVCDLCEHYLQETCPFFYKEERRLKLPPKGYCDCFLPDAQAEAHILQRAAEFSAAK